MNDLPQDILQTADFDVGMKPRTQALLDGCQRAVWTLGGDATCRRSG